MNGGFEREERGQASEAAAGDEMVYGELGDKAVVVRDGGGAGAGRHSGSCQERNNLGPKFLSFNSQKMKFKYNIGYSKITQPLTLSVVALSRTTGRTRLIFLL